MHDPAAYGEAWSGAYDRLYESRDDPALVCEALFHAGPGRRVLDFGIGTGRLALPLAEAGFDVAGIEASAAMIEVLRAKPGGEHIRVELGDFVSTRIDGEFDIVLIAFSTLFLLPDQDTQLTCLANAAGHLAPDGIAIVEAFVPDHTRWDSGRRVSLSRWDETSVELEVARHDRAAQRIDVRYVTLADGGIRQRPLALRYAWPAEIDLMARAAGLSLRRRTAGWAGDPFDASSVSHLSFYARSDGG